MKAMQTVSEKVGKSVSGNSHSPTHRLTHSPFVPFDLVVAHVLACIKHQELPYVMLADDDERIIHVARWLKEIGDDARLINYAEEEAKKQISNNLRFCLGNLAAFLLLWLTANEPDYRNGLAAIREERIRQTTLFLAKKIGFDCSSAVVDNRRKFRALFEEAGEVAQAIDKLETAPRWATPDYEQALKAEKTQLAAVCFAWLEALESKS